MTDLEQTAERLQNGWVLIDKTRDAEQAQRLTDHWLTLEQQYRTLCDERDWQNPEHHELIAKRSLERAIQEIRRIEERQYA